MQEPRGSSKKGTGLFPSATIEASSASLQYLLLAPGNTKQTSEERTKILQTNNKQHKWMMQGTGWATMYLTCEIKPGPTLFLNVSCLNVYYAIQSTSTPNSIFSAGTGFFSFDLSQLKLLSIFALFFFFYSSLLVLSPSSHTFQFWGDN